MIYAAIIFLFILLLSILSKLKLNSLKFFVGTIGSFLICITILKSPIEQIIKYYFMNCISYISGYLMHLDVYKEAAALIINSTKGDLSLVINYECLGVMEHITYTILVLFLPFILKEKRIIYILAGNMYILIVNIVRMLLIVDLIKIFGAGSYMEIHKFWVRIIFFISLVLLFFFVFTRNHVSNQKIGGKE